MKFRKKPLIIDAVLFTGKNEEEIMVFMNAAALEKEFLEEWIEIRTLEGTMRAIPGDWIIKGTAGEFYPCKPGIFAKTYERVE